MSQAARTAYLVETIPYAKVKNSFGSNPKLARHEPCVLCGSASRMFANGADRAVDCDACGRYLLSVEASEMVDESRSDGSWTKADSGYVSAFIRYHRAPGHTDDWVLVTPRTFEHLRVPRTGAAVPPHLGYPVARRPSLPN